MFCCPPNEGVFPRFDCAALDPNNPPPPAPPPAPPPPPPLNIPGLFAPGGGPAGVVEGALNNPPPTLGAGVEAINAEPVFPPKDGLPVAGPPPPPPLKSPPVVGVEDGAAPPCPNNPELVFCWPPNEGPELLADGVPKREPGGLGVEEAPP